MRVLILASIAIALGCFSTGCASSGTYGTKIDSGNVAKIVKGQTTRQEVETMFGQPTGGTYALIPSHGRQGTWVCSKSRTSMGPVGMFIPGGSLVDGMKTTSHQQTLQVMFNSQDIVEDFSYSGQTSKSDTSAFGGGARTTTDAQLAKGQ